MGTPLYATFQTEYRVRPDDIDMYRHVHNSKYLDYVLAAGMTRWSAAMAWLWKYF